MTIISWIIEKAQHSLDFFDTLNNALTGVGVDRKTWENVIAPLADGKTYTQTITDKTMPGGPVERTIEYVAPFDRCDREQDYETAWKFFEKKYGK